jgi:hypothetical protein
MKMNINEVRQQIIAIKALVTDGDDVLLHDMIEGETSLEDLLLYLLKQLSEYEAAIIGRKALIKDWQNLNATKELQIEKTRELALQLLQDSGLPSYRTPLGNISIAKGRDGVFIDENLHYDDRFYKTVKTLDKTAIKEAIANGETIQGVVKTNAKPHIIIRK